MTSSPRRINRPQIASTSSSLASLFRRLCGNRSLTLVATHSRSTTWWGRTERLASSLAMSLLPVARSTLMEWNCFLGQPGRVWIIESIKYRKQGGVFFQDEEIRSWGFGEEKCIAYLVIQGEQEGHEEVEHSPEGGSNHQRQGLWKSYKQQIHTWRKSGNMSIRQKHLF